MSSAKYLTPNLFVEIENMKNKMDKIMEKNFEKFRCSSRTPSGTWEPITDVYETEKCYVIQVELPGVEKEEVNIEIRPKELLIYGEKKLIKDTSTISYVMLERCFGSFLKKFTLPDNVDKDRISAHMELGVLTIKLPKKDIKIRDVKIYIQVEE